MSKQYYEPPYHMEPIDVWEPGSGTKDPGTMKHMGWAAGIIDKDGYHLFDGFQNRIFGSKQEVLDTWGIRDSEFRLEARPPKTDRLYSDFASWIGNPPSMYDHNRETTDEPQG